MVSSTEKPVVRTGDRTVPLLQRHMPVTVVLDQLRSAFNVGNIFRVAEAVRVAKVVTCGYTPTPPHAKLAKTARGCDQLLPIEHADTALTALRQLRQRGCRVYGVETVDGAVPVWELADHFPTAVIFGNEALGINPDALAECDGFIALPCLGLKNSINVGNCAAVVLYEMLRRWLTITSAAISEKDVSI